MIKQILKRAAILSFLGCIIVIGIAAHRDPNCKEDGKEFDKNAELKESIVEANTPDHSYDLRLAGKIFKFFVD